jgi:drug/metabolite transporter (DMT)-like permease
MKSAVLHVTTPEAGVEWLTMLAMQWRVWLAGACLITAFGTWMFILRNTRLSVSFPATSLTYIGIIIGSHLLFGESLSLIHYAGVALIVTGVAFLRSVEGWDDDV